MSELAMVLLVLAIIGIVGATWTYYHQRRKHSRMH